jgi:ATP-dependent protease Clp ATPase subunit
VAENTGARGLRRILVCLCLIQEKVLEDALFEYPGTQKKFVVLLKECVTAGEPVLAFDAHEEAEAFTAAGVAARV